jgi:carbon monoxide dehydrogenase subunit G
MSDRTAIALAAARSIRASTGFATLSLAERAPLERDLARIEQALRARDDNGGSMPSIDPYAISLETPADLQRGNAPPPDRRTAPPEPTPPPAPPRPAGTEVIGARARQALEAVDFPSFVAGLVSGTFQAIVDATAQQIREYATLVASLSRSVDEFSRDNVTPNQVRDWLAARHPHDLVVKIPRPGERGSPRLAPRQRNAGSPEWLAQYGLGEQELTEELTDGPLLDAGRRGVAEERLQTLATMVLIGINRIVVDDGQIKARLQFHASARESVKAETVSQTGGQQVGIAGRQVQMQTAVSTMVSTVNVNAQADVSVKADLMGEVAIKFRSETFDLNRFADSQAIQLINRHARVPENAPAAAPAAPARPPAVSGGTP